MGRRRRACPNCGKGAWEECVDDSSTRTGVCRDGRVPDVSELEVDKIFGRLGLHCVLPKTSHGWGLIRLSLGRCKVQLAAQYRISVWNILTRIKITHNGNAAGQSRPAQPIKTVSSLVDRVSAPHENRYRATERPAFDASCNLFQRARQFAAGGCQPLGGLLLVGLPSRH